MNIEFHSVSPDDPEAVSLIEELSATLAQITGDSGMGSFSNTDIQEAKSLFLLVKVQGVAVACGAVRKIDVKTCELKRMYSKTKRSGIGSMLLAQLEREAARFGYEHMRLETRKINQGAVSFYSKHGFSVVPNYGKYVGRDDAVCLGKKIVL